MVMIRPFTTDGEADRRFDAGLGQAFAVADGHVLRPAVAVVDQRNTGQSTVLANRWKLYSDPGYR